MKSCLEVWVLIIDVFWLEIRAGLWSMPQATTRGRSTCFSLFSDNNNWSVYISSAVCLFTLFPLTVISLHLSFSCRTRMLCSSTFISTIPSIWLQSNLSTCHVPTLGCLSHCSLSLSKLLHFGWSFPVISYFLEHFWELSMNPRMIQQDFRNNCCWSSYRAGSQWQFKVRIIESLQ